MFKNKTKNKNPKKAAAPRNTDLGSCRRALGSTMAGSPGQALAAADAPPLKISLCSSQFGEAQSRCLWVLASVHFLRRWVVKNSSHGCLVWVWDQEEAMSLGLQLANILLPWSTADSSRILICIHRCYPLQCLLMDNNSSHLFLPLTSNVVRFCSCCAAPPYGDFRSFVSVCFLHIIVFCVFYLYSFCLYFCFAVLGRN